MKDTGARPKCPATAAAVAPMPDCPSAEAAAGLCKSSSSSAAPSSSCRQRSARVVARIAPPGVASSCGSGTPVTATHESSMLGAALAASRRADVGMNATTLSRLPVQGVPAVALPLAGSLVGWPGTLRMPWAGVMTLLELSTRRCRPSTRDWSIFVPCFIEDCAAT